VAHKPGRDVVLAALLMAVTISSWSCRKETSQPKEAATSAAPPVARLEPTVILSTPLSGSGHELNTSVIFHDDAGQLNMTDLYLLINEPARGADGTGGCVVWDRRTTGDVFLLEDAGKKWLGPHKAGSDTVLVNSQCLVSLKNTGLAEVKGDLQWVTSVAFSKPFSGPKQIYAKAVNRQQRESNFALLGSWTAN
jgi:hypothetical protein